MRQAEREQSEPRQSHRISGDYSLRVPPVPIPNTEVKPQHADSTWLETAREGRSSPDSIRTFARMSFLFVFRFGIMQHEYCIWTVGSAVTSFILSCFSVNGKTPTIRTESDNDPMLHIIEKIGFGANVNL